MSNPEVDPTSLPETVTDAPMDVDSVPARIREARYLEVSNSTTVRLYIGLRANDSTTTVALGSVVSNSTSLPLDLDSYGNRLRRGTTYRLAYRASPTAAWRTCAGRFIYEHTNPLMRASYQVTRNGTSWSCVGPIVGPLAVTYSRAAQDDADEFDISGCPCDS